MAKRHRSTGKGKKTAGRRGEKPGKGKTNEPSRERPEAEIMKSLVAQMVQELPKKTPGRESGHEKKKPKARVTIKHKDPLDHMLNRIYAAADMRRDQPHKVIFSGGFVLGDEAKGTIQSTIDNPEHVDQSYCDLSKTWAPKNANPDLVIHVPMDRMHRRFFDSPQHLEEMRAVSKPTRDIDRIAPEIDAMESYALPCLRARKAIGPTGRLCLASVVDEDRIGMTRDTFEGVGGLMGMRIVDSGTAELNIPGGERHMVYSVMKLPPGQRLTEPLSTTEERIKKQLAGYEGDLEILKKRRELNLDLQKDRGKVAELAGAMNDPKAKLKDQARAARQLRDLFERVRKQERDTRKTPYNDLNRDFLRDHKGRYGDAVRLIGMHEDTKAKRAVVKRKLDEAVKRVEKYHRMLRNEKDPGGKARLASLIHRTIYKVVDGAEKTGMEHFAKGGVYAGLFDRFDRKTEKAYFEAEDHLKKPPEPKSHIKFPLPKHLKNS